MSKKDEGSYSGGILLVVIGIILCLTGVGAAIGIPLIGFYFLRAGRNEVVKKKNPEQWKKEEERRGSIVGVIIFIVVIIVAISVILGLQYNSENISNADINSFILH